MKQRNSLLNETKSFLLDWDSFPIDFWWRKKYNVPFGSRQHREMNFIDMYIEWTENLEMAKFNSEPTDGWTEEDERNLGLKTENGSEPLTQAEINEDYENLDLSQFDK